jgi:hypothetical protein
MPETEAATIVALPVATPTGRWHTRLPRRAGRRTLLAAASLLVAPTAVAVPAVAGAPVVVELFTSQGCSSCPPADRLLSVLGTDAELGKRIVPLAFHVDYWNHIGWKDPFSARAWSQRQEGYLRPTGAEGIYTPQAVINGRRQCLGSDAECIREAVEAEAARPSGSVAMKVVVSEGGVLRVEVSAEPPAGEGALDVMLAVVESGLETPVARGENASKVLRNDFVVRKLQRAFALTGAPRTQTLELPLERGWRRAGLRVTVFLQEPRSKRIAGVATVQVPAG